MSAPVRILYFEPQIPNNTGSSMRLSAITGAELHVVRPLGFVLDDARLKRAGLDYRDQARFFVHDSWEDAMDILMPARIFAFTAHAQRVFYDIMFEPGDVLLFGPEKTGLPEHIVGDERVTEAVRIPMLPNQRSLNLATATGIAVYEAWRQHGCS